MVGDGPWVLTWDGGEGYPLETLDDTGAALSVLDKVSYATPAPTAAVLYPWADAHAWTVPPTTANPRLADWLSQTWNSGGPAGGRPVALGPAAALGLVRPRTDPNAAVDGALFGQWAQAVTTQLPGCTLAAHTTGTQMWANDPDQAVVLGPPGTDLAAVRCAARAVTDALGWAGPTPTNPARDLPAGALAAAATVVRAGLEYQVAAQAASSAAVGRSAAFLVALTTEMDAAAAAEAAARGLPAPNPQATRAGWAKVVAHLGAGSGGEARPAARRRLESRRRRPRERQRGGWGARWAEDHRRVGPARAAAQQADQARVGTWRAATGHGFTAEQVATLDGRTTAAQVPAALTTGAPVGTSSRPGAAHRGAPRWTRSGPPWPRWPATGWPPRWTRRRGGPPHRPPPPPPRPHHPPRREAPGGGDDHRPADARLRCRAAPHPPPRG